jgi:deoxycytidine triphosphate deaminase
MADPSFAASDHEAETRYQKYRNLDPYPSIPEALLNSADLADYVAVTGLIHPFNYSSDALKPASYEVPLGGDYIYYDEAGSLVEGKLGDGDEFLLKPNSLVFLTLAPMFRVPEYLALRFNLRISLVYRGLLVGTGPLVDPGFHGNLSLPLHNLTANDYKLVGGEGLIWVEVTKIRPSKVAEADVEPRRGRVFALPVAKKDLTLRQYLRKADPNRAIRSSIPGLLQDANVRLREAQNAAQQAVAAADRVQRRELIAAAIGVVGVIFAAVAVFTAVHGLIDTTNFRVDTTNARIDQLSQQVRPSASLDVIQRQVTQLNARICQLELQAHQPVSPACTSPSPSP